MLGRAFQPFGVVKDAYVAKKRDSMGNYFGFIRYEGVTDVMEVLRGMNTVKIRLNVSLAKYDRNHQGFTNQQVASGLVQQMQQKQAMQYQNQYKPPPIYVPVRRKGDGVLYSEALVGKKEASSWKVIHLQQRDNLYPDHCMMRSVMMTVKGVKEADEIKPMLEKGEYPRQ
ncbi:putative nucleotide-binding alpha-beta plait domain superfamily, RNA-binding domain superfamily [Helianthus annuus]|nr:putative nucleotide-binding alpha-beta plait domain superfamily, RNA-binding domain superfamily [Helianthus annuus]